MLVTVKGQSCLTELG